MNLLGLDSPLNHRTEQPASELLGPSLPPPKKKQNPKNQNKKRKQNPQHPTTPKPSPPTPSPGIQANQVLLLSAGYSGKGFPPLGTSSESPVAPPWERSTGEAGFFRLNPPNHFWEHSKEDAENSGAWEVLLKRSRHSVPKNITPVVWLSQTTNSPRALKSTMTSSDAKTGEPLLKETIPPAKKKRGCIYQDPQDRCQLLFWSGFM